MKNLILISVICFVALVCLTTAVTGQEIQEILVGGNMEDSSAWHVSNLDSKELTEYEFNDTFDTPAAGEGGCLYIWGSTVQNTQLLIWQPVTLVGGGEYTVTGAFADLTGGNLSNFWCEILVSTEAPPDSPGVDYGGVRLLGFNTWDGCGNNVDGTFQDDGCLGSTGGILTVPEALGETVTYYFCLNPGAWSADAPATGSLIEFEIAVDELSMIGPAPTVDVKDKPGASLSHFQLHQNYPNPFNPATTIPYSIEKESHTTIKIYNMLGEYVTTLIDQKQLPDDYSVVWDGSDFSGKQVNSGVYLVKMEAGGFTKTQKMLLMQ
jgi:hypothetical protein